VEGKAEGERVYPQEPHRCYYFGVRWRENVVPLSPLPIRIKNTLGMAQFPSSGGTPSWEPKTTRNSLFIQRGRSKKLSGTLRRCVPRKEREFREDISHKAEIKARSTRLSERKRPGGRGSRTSA